METKEYNILRDKINGKEVYCRVPIIRKGYPVTQCDIDTFESYQNTYNISDEELQKKACDISNMGGYEFAGKIFSYMDMKQGKEYMFLEECEGD